MFQKVPFLLICVFGNLFATGKSLCLSQVSWRVLLPYTGSHTFDVYLPDWTLEVRPVGADDEEFKLWLSLQPDSYSGCSHFTSVVK